MLAYGMVVHEIHEYCSFGWKYNNGGHKIICINNSNLLWDHILEATYKGGHLKAHANEWG